MLRKSALTVYKRLITEETCRCCFSSSNVTATAAVTTKWLDLRGSGLSVLERLCLEECLYQGCVSDCNWIIAGCHEASRHRYMKPPPITRNYTSTYHSEFDGNDPNESVAIVLGIGGKPQKLLNIEKVQQDSVQCIKRFSGGGTVVLDHDCIWTTIIGRRTTQWVPQDQLFPRPIMEWSANALFGPLFEKLARKQQQQQHLKTSTEKQINEKQTMVMDTKSCSATDNSGRTITIPYKVVTIPAPKTTTTSTTTTEQGKLSSSDLPKFELLENDYVLSWSKDDGHNVNKKMGGNAQAIGKFGFLHHTSFLWDYENENMQYLTLPSKRPEYRADRNHDDFLCKLHEVYPNLSKQEFFHALSESSQEELGVEQATLYDAIAIVNQVTNGGGLQGWFETKSRNKVLTNLV